MLGKEKIQKSKVSLLERPIWPWWKFILSSISHMHSSIHLPQIDNKTDRHLAVLKMPTLGSSSWYWVSFTKDVARMDLTILDCTIISQWPMCCIRNLPATFDACLGIWTDFYAWRTAIHYRYHQMLKGEWVTHRSDRHVLMYRPCRRFSAVRVRTRSM